MISYNVSHSRRHRAVVATPSDWSAVQNLLPCQNPSTLISLQLYDSALLCDVQLASMFGACHEWQALK